jgi:thymidylate kinase
MTEKEHIFNLKITIEGAEGHGKTLVTTQLREMLNGMGACVIVRDHQGDPDDGEFRHHMPDTAPRCTFFPLAQTMVHISTKYPK